MAGFLCKVPLVSLINIGCCTGNLFYQHCTDVLRAYMSVCLPYIDGLTSITSDYINHGENSLYRMNFVQILYTFIRNVAFVL